MDKKTTTTTTTTETPPALTMLPADIDNTATNPVQTTSNTCRSSVGGKYPKGPNKYKIKSNTTGTINAAN